MAVSLSIDIIQNSQSIENNTSNITVNVVCSWSGGSYNLSDISWGVPQSNGQLNVEGEISYFNSYINKYRTTNGSEVIYSKNITVEHDAEGKRSIECSASFNTYISDGIINAYASKVLTDIPRYATILSAPNFNDEENPKITYSNPAGTNVSSLQACISLDETNIIVSYRDITKTATSYTFRLTTSERDALREATVSNNSSNVRFYIRTTIGDTTEATYLTRKLTIKNPNPTINPTITDQNSTTITLTGDSSKLIKYYSNANVTFNAAAVKKATLTSKKVTCGNNSLTADGTINGIDSNNFVFTATDSRGNTTTKTVTPSFVEYVKLTCNLGDDLPSTDGTMTVTASGRYFNGSFGSKHNSLKVYYRYKIKGKTFNEWLSMTVELGENAYTATANISGLDYQTSYVVQTYAVDSLAEVYSAEKIVKATPVFDWGESDFNFNVPVTMHGFDNIPEIISITEVGTTDTLLKEIFADMKNGSTRTLVLNQSVSDSLPVSGTWFVTIYRTNSKYGVMKAIRHYSGDVICSIEYRKAVYNGDWSEWDNLVYGSDILNLAYPINSIYISYSHTSPASLFGGTWQRIQNRFLWGISSSDTIGSTSGEKKHTLTIDEMPKHAHSIAGSVRAYSENGNTSFPAEGWANSAVEFYETNESGNGAAHNNMPPYINVSIWRRTA